MHPVAIYPAQASASVEHRRDSSGGIGIVLQATLLLGLIWYLFGDVLTYLAHDWWYEPAYSQGLLIPPLAVYIAWLNKHLTLRYPAVPDARGLVLTSLACGLFILGSVASEFFLTRVSFVILLAGVIWTFWGPDRLRTLMFPLILLVTMVPLPTMVYNSVAGPLQLLASSIGTGIAQAAGVSIYREGNILHLSNTTLGVAEACSGLHSLTSLLAGSVLFGFLFCNTALSRILLTLSAIPIAVAINVVRVGGTAILADYHEEFSLGFYHSFSGWLVFLLEIALLYFTAWALHRVLERK
jgi:exosortase